MRLTDINFLIGGEAGQGVQSMGYIFTMSMAKGGYYVFANQDYESRIRGGHNFFKVRISNSPVRAVSEKVHVIIALNQETINIHKVELLSDGIIIYDGEKTQNENKRVPLLSVPFERLALEKTGNKIMSNVVALGAALSLVKFDLNILISVLKKRFSKKSLDIVDKNVKAVQAGYNYIQRNNKAFFNYTLASIGKSTRIVINGVEAVALGALAAGCKFVSGYPMTPSTGILQYFAGKSKAYNVVFEQAEDEIAALNMVIGASYAGVRAMTATSGGGFSLMVEALSLAGMTETPAVIVLGQRVGPATGFPTRTEQGELEFAIYAGHGMFPRAVFAPGTVEEAFYLTAKAFNIAEKYQIPVIVLTDTFLSDSYVTAEKFDLSKIMIEKGVVFSEEELRAMGKYAYMRHKFTDSGVSPRAIPGQPFALVVTDSDEHTENGHITESAEIRKKMVKKRLKKMEGIRNEMASPHTYGHKNADIILLGWGSTYGALREAVIFLNKKGNNVRMIHLSEVWPFPKESFIDLVKGSEKLLVVESNPTGQMAHLIRAETGLKASGKILRYDGRPLTPTYIMNQFLEEVKK